MGFYQLIGLSIVTTKIVEQTDVRIPAFQETALWEDNLIS